MPRNGSEGSESTVSKPGGRAPVAAEAAEEPGSRSPDTQQQIKWPEGFDKKKFDKNGTKNMKAALLSFCSGKF